MKKVAIALIAVLTAVSLAACAGKDPVGKGKGKGKGKAPAQVVTKG